MIAPLAFGLSSLLLVFSIFLGDLQQSALARFRLQSIADSLVLAAAAEQDLDLLLAQASVGKLEITEVAVDNPEPMTKRVQVCGRPSITSPTLCAVALARSG